MMHAAIPPFSKRFRLLLPLLLTVMTTASCGDGSDATLYENTISQMTPFIEQQMKDDSVTGLAIALVDDQRVVWERGFGYADAARNVSATKDTLFEIGSNSKTFTASLVMQLAEAGRLSIDDPVTRHLPGFAIGQPLGSFPSPGGPITIRTMMNHHAGIPGDLLNGAFTGSVKYPDYNARLMAALAGEYADYPTNFLLAYSNTAISLLSDVVAAASGRSFKERSQQFFADLGMDHSTFYRESATVPANQSKGYVLGQEYGPFYCNIEPAGSILSSASDMAKYLKMVMAGGIGERGRVLKSETINTILTRTNSSVALDYDTSIGLGWFLSDPEMAYAGRICWHNGGTILMMSHMEVLRDHKLAVMVMTNSMTGGTVAENVAKKALKLALEEKMGIRPPEPPAPVPSPIVTWTDAQLDAVAGIYVTGSGYDLLNRVAGGLQWTSGAGLATAASGSLPGTTPRFSANPVIRKPSAGADAAGSVQKLVPRANGWFSLPDSQQNQYEFKEVEGRRVMIGHTGGRTSLRGERYIPAVIPPSWIARLGRYDLANLDADDASRYLPAAYRLMSSGMELKTKNGLLIMEWTDGAQSGQQYVIHPLSGGLGYLRGLGRNLGGSVQAVIAGAGEEIQFLGLRYAKRLK